MFKLIENKVPEKATTHEVEVKNSDKYADLILTYVASPSREHFFATTAEKELVFAIAVTSAKIKLGEDVTNVDKVHVYGEPSDEIFGILGITDNTNLEVEVTAVKRRARGSKFAGYKYVEMNNSENQIMSLSGKLEEYLYTNVPIEELIGDKDMSWLKNKNYRILTNRLEIIEWVRGLAKTKEIVGFDTETSGLRVNRTHRDVLVGICMSYEDNGGVYFPLRQERFENIDMDIDEFLEMIKPYIDVNSEKKKELVTHNGAFDWKVMKMHGIELNLVYDTFIRQSLHDVAGAKGIRKLKDMSSKILGIDVVEMDEMYEKRTPKEMLEIKKAIDDGMKINPITKYKFDVGTIEYSKAGTEKLDMKFKDILDFRFASKDFSEIYGPADADFPRLIHKYMDRTIDKKEQEDLSFIYSLEMGLLSMIGEQEYYGVKVVEKGFEKLLKEAEDKKKKLQEEIYEIAGEEFNINSSKEKTRIFFTKLGMPAKERYKSKKTKELGTGKAVLDDLIQISTGERDEYGELIPKYPIVQKLMQYNKTEKLITSFYGKIPKLVTDGYIFPNYQTVLVETGRLSSNGPNIQQTEPSSRKYMVPDSDDYYFLVCDYSQAEYRIMAGLSGEQKVIEFFNNNPEADYHILAYANMMHKAYEDVTTKERKIGKVLNFGTTYGLEDQNLALKLYGKDDAINQQMASQARDDYFNGVPILRDYFEAVRDTAEIRGYTETSFKRRRKITDFYVGDKLLTREQLNSPKYSFRKGGGRRKAGNMPVQGTAADIMKIAMTRLRAKFRGYGFYEDKARAVLNVHDEMCYCIHKSIHPWLATAIMREAMEINLHNIGKNGAESSMYLDNEGNEIEYNNGIPNMYVGANVGYNWLDGKADELEAPVILMDRMCAWAMDKFKKGEALPEVTDQREYWRQQIIKFTMEVVQTETAKGWEKGGEKGDIIDLPTALKNMRLAKYAHAFEEYENMVILEILDKKDNPTFFEEFYNKYNWYKGWNSDLAKRNIEEVKEMVEHFEYKTIDELASNNSILNKLAYFGKYSGNVAEYILKGDDAISKLKSDYIYKGFIKRLSEIYSIIEKDYINNLGELMDNFEAFNIIKNYKGIKKEELEILISEGVKACENKIKSTRLIKGKALSKPKEEKTGQQLEEELKSLDDLVKKSIVKDVISVNGRQVGGAKLKLEKDDAIIYNMVDSMLISNNKLNQYKDSFIPLTIEFSNGTRYMKTGYMLPVTMGKLLRRAIKEHYLEEEDNIRLIQQEIPIKLDELLKEEYKQTAG